MAFSLKVKKEILSLVNNGMSVSEASRKYGVARTTISKWLKDPENFLKEDRGENQPYDIEDKIDVIRLFDKGDLSIHQIARIKNLKYHTIRHWIKDKNHILALYSSQGQSNTIYELPKSPGEEDFVSMSDNKDTKQHIKDLKNENELLKAKVEFLEELMELNGTPVSSFKKKLYTKPSTDSSKKDSEM